MSVRPSRILDPNAIPVVGIDAHLPPVPAHRLLPDALRQRFADPPIYTPEFPGDGGSLQHDAAPAAAAVLVALVMRDQGLQVLLTQRTAHLRDHAGQVSFPGGRCEPDDVDEVATALRETEEEIGLDRSFIEVIGQLPVYTTVTRFRVTPVVALVQPGFTLLPDSYEVAEVFEVPLAFVMSPAHHRRHSVAIDGQQRHFLSMSWADAQRQDEPYFIWGATAAMLRNLYGYLSL